MSDTLVTVLTRMDALLQQHPILPIVKNPVLPSENFNRHWTQTQYANFRSRVNSQAQNVRKAKAEESSEKAVKIWRELFGEKFAKGSSGSGGNGRSATGNSQQGTARRAAAGGSAGSGIPVARRNEARRFG